MKIHNNDNNKTPRRHQRDKKSLSAGSDRSSSTCSQPQPRLAAEISQIVGRIVLIIRSICAADGRDLPLPSHRHQVYLSVFHCNQSSDCIHWSWWCTDGSRPLPIISRHIHKKIMKRAISTGSSGDGDEFFDAVENLDDSHRSNGNRNGKSLERRGHRQHYFKSSLRESNLEENSQSSSSSDDPPMERQESEEDELWMSARALQTSDRQLRVKEHLPPPPPPRTPLKDTQDVWMSAKSTMSKVGSSRESWNTPCTSLLDNMPSASESMSYEENNNGDERAISDTNNAASATKPVIVPPINLDSLRRSDTDIYTVPSEEINQIVEKKFDEEDEQTLNRLVDKLKAAELSRPVIKEEEKSSVQHQHDDSAMLENQAIVVKNEKNGQIDKHESIQEESSPERYFTPQKIDCITNMVGCDVKSPLEALYLFCPKGMTYATNTGGSKKTVRSPPTRTSVTNEEDVAEKNTPLQPLTDHGSTDENNVGRQLVLDSDSSSDGDDSSSSSYKQHQMINRDTGSIHDMRDVMKEINEAGSSDALDTGYSFLPTKNQLVFQRQSTLSSLEAKGSEESRASAAVPLAAASFDSEAMEVQLDATPDTTPKQPRERKKGGVKFTRKFASSIKGLKTSRQQKLNRKRTSSSDILPRNAIHARSSSRHLKQSKSNLSEHASETNQADSSFNPMLLIKTVPNAHKGPAWCASFSPNGRFLATGGEDGHVCIWAVAPKSKSMHPNGVTTAQQEESHEKQSGSEDAENGENKEKEPNASAPPLNFAGSGPELATNLEILSSEPIQRFKDHTADVIDLSWSHTNFLLSASIDKTVRLYHFSKPDCLHLFKHANLVASVAFHPKDDRYFISGGIDKKLRLWDITDGRVKEWAQAPDVITAARFTPDGKYAVAGLFRGQVYFYNVDGLKYYTQIACRNGRGKHKQGKKVTGISFVRGERDDWLGAAHSSAQGLEKATSTADNSSSLTERLSDTGKGVARRLSSALRIEEKRAETLRYTERMLVSTNDSRVRLYGLNDFQLVRKYKGHTNYSMQIRARISESGNHIISGSESGHCFIWDTLDKNRPKKNNMKVNQTHDKTKRSDHFEATKAPLPIITDSVFFPSRSMKQALLTSEKVFPFVLGIDRVNDDLSSAAVLTLDYDGTMRVFLRKSCIDNILDAATPRGGTMT